MAAVTSVEEPSLSITSAGEEQPIVDQPAQPAQPPATEQPAAPPCDDLPTPDNFTCAQQAVWGKVRKGLGWCAGGLGPGLLEGAGGRVSCRLPCLPHLQCSYHGHPAQSTCLPC